MLQRAMDKHRAGDHAAARPLYLAYLESNPSDAEAYCLLASLEGEQGDHGGAEEAFGKAIAARGDHAPAHAGLGVSLLLQGRPAEAADALRRAIELQPEQPEWRLQFALALRDSGRLKAAIRAVAELVKRWPENVQGHYNLAVLAMEGGNPDLAAEHFQFVVREQPDRLPALVGLGRALIAANDPVGAAAALNRAAELAPSDAEVSALRGNLLRNRGRFQDAVACYRQALGARPGHVGATVGLADIDRRVGHPEEGLARLQPLLESASPPPQARLVAARLLLRAGRDEEAVRLIDSWLTATDLTVTARASLLSLKGHALDRLGECDAAWAAWSESHESVPRRFDGDHFDQAIDALIEAYRPQLFSRRDAVRSPDGPSPLLIFGTPRSGKSILEQMLACHPEVKGGGECRHLGVMTNHIVGMTGGRTYPGCVADLTEAQLQRLSTAYAEAVAANAGNARWLVDTQPTNFLHVGLAALIAPGVRLIFCERDPVDAAWACFGRRFADPALAFVATPQGIGRYMAGMGRIMRHWASAIPIDVLTVSYEDLVRDPRFVVERALGHIGLEWDDACADYAAPGRADLESAPVLSRPVDDREIGRGQPYRRHFAAVAEILSGSTDAS
jgi:tetratricopeptide (TPR) repeat protein